MTHAPNSAAARDIAYQLHPYTDARRHEQQGPFIITHGDGVYVYDDAGNRYIEGLAGLWCTSLGFGEERLVQAAAEQMRRLPYYHGFAHRAHPPSIELAERLLAIAPQSLSKVLFSTSGSEAVDTAVKLVWYYNNARGRPQKKKIISRVKGYHGVTVAAASLTGLPHLHRDFDLPIANILHAPCPHHYRNAEPGETEEAFAARMAAELEALILREGPDTVAAFIGEPVMGAGGVIVPPAGYWARVQEVCRRHDVLVVADEVICGFGRTGKMFGCETFGITPDMMTVAKALSSAYLPISALLLSDEIYQALADNSSAVGMLGHGYTYGGHPVSAAVALETVKIYEERRILDHVAEVGPHLQARLTALGDHPLVGEARGIGLIGAIELVADKPTRRPFDPVGKVAAHAAQRAIAHGAIVRNLGDTIAFCPPLIIKPDEIDALVDAVAAALDDTQVWIEREARSLIGAA